MSELTPETEESQEGLRRYAYSIFSAKEYYDDAWYLCLRVGAKVCNLDAHGVEMHRITCQYLRYRMSAVAAGLKNEPL